MSIRLLIAERLKMVRDLLSSSLAREADFEVVGAAETGKEAIEICRKSLPDILLLDLGVSDGALEVTRTLKKKLPRVKILALSAHAEEYFVRPILKAGADGYLLKTSGLPELVRAVHVVADDRLYVSPDAAKAALGIDPRFQFDSKLTSREQEILSLVADGKRSAQIAARLSISVATVEAHRTNIIRKLGLRSIAELTKYAIRRGLTALQVGPVVLAASVLLPTEISEAQGWPRPESSCSIGALTAGGNVEITRRASTAGGRDSRRARRA
jgi:two-component system, NarL family, response regulator NreC